jgi:hypothetical protein
VVGTTLVELLVALTVTVLVLGTALTAVIPASIGFRTLPDHADVQQRLRAVADTLRADVWGAVSGTVARPDGGSSPAWPTIFPCGWGIDPVAGSPGPCARPDTFSIVRLERPLSVSTLAALGTASAAVPVRRPVGCPVGSSGCEFEAGDRVVMGDGTGFVDVFVVSGVSAQGAELDHAEPLSVAYDRGATVLGGAIRTYYVKPDLATDSLQLRRLDGAADVPVVDHLAAFTIEYAGHAEPPLVSRDVSGRWVASYGLQPRLSRNSEGELDGGVLPSCAFDVVDGAPASTLLPLPANGDGLATMPLPMLADGPWCPAPDSPYRFDADLFRVSRIRVVVRTQSPSRWARGQHHGFYARPGSGTDSARLVPDAGVRFDIVVRGAGR